MKLLKSWAAAAAMLVLTSAAHAALVNRGGGMIYDTTLNVTWLADMNYVQTSGHSGIGVNADGSMTWDAAKTWANNLVYGSFSDWRLPTLNPSDTSCTGGYGAGVGFNCTGGELSHLFVTDLGNKATESVLTQVGDTADQIANLALFSNVQADGYWSGTEYALSPGSAWYFYSVSGVQAFDAKSIVLYAVVVRPGDVSASVPEPATLALLSLGLAGIAATRRKRQA